VKIKRDAFLYLDPKAPNNTFAQCGTCMMFTGKTCTIHGKNVKITGDMSCGLYVHGKPMPEEQGHEMKSVTPKESGLVNEPVRCENCVSFDARESECELYEHLNEHEDSQFDLDKSVKAKGCCNAFRGKKKKSSLIKSIDDIRKRANAI